jgi:hypothetical protein
LILERKRKKKKETRKTGKTDKLTIRIKYLADTVAVINIIIECGT